jgi:hypothetical protein
MKTENLGEEIAKGITLALAPFLRAEKPKNKSLVSKTPCLHVGGCRIVFDDSYNCGWHPSSDPQGLPTFRVGFPPINAANLVKCRIETANPNEGLENYQFEFFVWDLKNSEKGEWLSFYRRERGIATVAFGGSFLDTTCLNASVINRDGCLKVIDWKNKDHENPKIEPLVLKEGSVRTFMVKVLQSNKAALPKAATRGGGEAKGGLFVLEGKDVKRTDTFATILLGCAEFTVYSEELEEF